MKIPLYLLRKEYPHILLWIYWAKDETTHAKGITFVLLLILWYDTYQNASSMVAIARLGIMTSCFVV